METKTKGDKTEQVHIIGKPTPAHMDVITKQNSTKKPEDEQQAFTPQDTL